MDLWCVAPRLLDELGYFPLVFVLRTLSWVPFFGQALRELGCEFGHPSDARMRALVARHHHAIVCPGGMREGTRPFWNRYTVAWQDRTGYLSLAARYGMRVVPAASHGVDDLYLGLTSGEAASRRLFGHGAMPIYLALGIGGVWPFALPFPAHIRTFFGQPLDVDDALSSDDAMAAIHTRVVAEVQRLLDRRMENR